MVASFTMDLDLEHYGSPTTPHWIRMRTLEWLKGFYAGCPFKIKYWVIIKKNNHNKWLLRLHKIVLGHQKSKKLW